MYARPPKFCHFSCCHWKKACPLIQICFRSFRPLETWTPWLQNIAKYWAEAHSPGAPNIFQQFCTVVTQSINCATASTVKLQAVVTDVLGKNQSLAPVQVDATAPSTSFTVLFPCFGLDGEWIGTAVFSDSGGGPPETDPLSADVYKCHHLDDVYRNSDGCGYRTGRRAANAFYYVSSDGFEGNPEWRHNHDRHNRRERAGPGCGGNGI